MDKFIEYAPYIVIAIGFTVSYGIFITPKQLSDKIEGLKEEIEQKYVRKDVNDVTLSQIKEDTSETKDKVNIIYETLMKKIVL